MAAPSIDFRNPRAGVRPDVARVPRRAHEILAIDFAHADTVFQRRLYILVVTEHGRRRVHLRRDHGRPHRAWVT